MLLPLGRRPSPLSKTRVPGEGGSRDRTVVMCRLTPPAPCKVPRKGLEAVLEKESHIALPVPAVQIQTLALPDHGRDLFPQERKGIVTNQRAVHALALLPVLLGRATLCPAPLPGEGGIPIPLLALALGVSQGHGLHHLKDEQNAIEPESCTAQHIGPTVVKVQSQMGKS